ncbi:MAG: 50S ribosomal protein L13 [Candidatus Omnitrophica bacterium]|nr:50S ribosomal protein L13 [Candidatus Omnitrophota bacterium]
MKSYLARPQEVVRRWHLLDADGKILGRLAVQSAVLLRGKHKPTWTPHIDTGDGVVIINAAKIRVTGRKMKQKTYQRYSGYPGGLKTETLEVLMKRKPTDALQWAIEGMVPKNPLGRAMLSRLKIYPSATHPHKGLTATTAEKS